MYNEIVMDHFNTPRNMGRIDEADMLIQVGDPSCGDSLLLFMKIEEDVLVDVKYKIYGCGAAIATSSMGSQLAKGRTLDAIMELTDKDVSCALGGLPAEKEHCSNLVISALHAGITEHRKNRNDPDMKPLKKKQSSRIMEEIITKNS